MSSESYYTRAPAHTQESTLYGRVPRRKPPPAFPYSTKYPPPDPDAPFSSLADLRKRAQISNTDLVATNEVITTPAKPQVQKHFLLTPDTQPSYTLSAASNRQQLPWNPETPVSKVISQPWYFLSNGYLSDTTKPSRPPR